MGLQDSDLDTLHSKLSAALATIKVKADLEMVRADWLGKDGLMKTLYRELKDVPAEIRPEVAAKLGKLKEAAESGLVECENRFQTGKRSSSAEHEFVDLSLPGKFPGHGTVHPITTAERKIAAILKPFGFQNVFGPEIETEYYCFDALNTPVHHPARDMQDTFYTANGLMLRTHTTSVQARTLQNGGLPIKIASFGRVYRNETEDPQHQAMFHQFELVWLEKGLTLSNLMALITHVLKALYNRRIKVRFIPVHYPYVEPGIGPHIDCAACKGEGCSFCKGSGWVAVGGAGMIHSKVLKEFNYDPAEVSGFAFGLGTSRLAANEFSLPTLKTLYENDVRILKALP